MALNKYVSNYRIYLEMIWLVPKCLDKKPNFMRVMPGTGERVQVKPALM